MFSLPLDTLFDFLLNRVMYETYIFVYLLHKLKYRLVFTLFGSFYVLPTLLAHLLYEGTAFTFFYLCLTDTNAVHDDDVKFSQGDSIHLNNWQTQILMAKWLVEIL